MSENSELLSTMHALGNAAKKASAVLAQASGEQKNQAIRAAAAAIRAHSAKIQTANAKDMAAGEAAGLSQAKLDRLLLNDARIEAMAEGLEDGHQPLPPNVYFEAFKIWRGMFQLRKRMNLIQSTRFYPFQRHK